MSRTLVGLILIAVLAAVILLAGPSACNRIRGLQAENKLNVGRSDSFANSAADAVVTQGRVNQDERASDEISASNEKDIRNAQGADQTVDPAVRDAGFASLCKRASFARSEAGKLHCPPAS